ncbi:hypothetical protein TOC8171_42730 [Pseudomonas syringae]
MLTVMTLTGTAVLTFFARVAGRVSFQPAIAAQVISRATAVTVRVDLRI